MGKTRDKPKVMLDSNIIISGIIYPRYCFEILNHAIKQDFQLLLSQIIIQEVNQNIQKKFPAHLLDLKDFLAKCPFELVKSPEKEEVVKNKVLLKDKTDIPILISAIQAEVDFFVTGDKGIMDNISETKTGFVCLAANAFLKEVMGWKSEDLEAIRHRTWKDLKK